jgi:hypothetical protein
MIVIREINELKEAEKIWEELSPQKSLFDDWRYRYCFYKYEPWPLRFFVAYEKQIDGREEAVGLMPLQYNKDWGGLEFFSEEACEENRIFVKNGYDQVIFLFYKNLTEKTKCYDISGDDDFTRNLPIEDYKYVLPLTEFKDTEDYFKKRFSSKGEHIKRYIKKINRLGVEVIEGETNDIETLFRLNEGIFGEESYLNKEGQRGWRDLLSLSDYFPIQLISMKIKGVVAAVSFSIFYNNVYYYLILGDDHQFPGLGKYLIKLNIDKAFSLGAKIFDGGLGDCNWKESWHLDRIPQYEFVKEN